jgi:hypothetical protein
MTNIDVSYKEWHSKCLIVNMLCTNNYTSSLYMALVTGHAYYIENTCTLTYVYETVDQLSNCLWSPVHTCAGTSHYLSNSYIPRTISSWTRC